MTAKFHTARNKPNPQTKKAEKRRTKETKIDGDKEGEDRKRQKTFVRKPSPQKEPSMEWNLADTLCETFALRGLE